MSAQHFKGGPGQKLKRVTPPGPKKRDVGEMGHAEAVLEVVDLRQSLERRAREVAELKEEIAFWKAETLECRNILADVVGARTGLEEKAIRYHSMPAQVEALNLFGAAQRFGKAHAAALLKKKTKMKRGRR